MTVAMRSPDGQVYHVDESEVDTLRRDQGWTVGEAAPVEPEGERTILKSREGSLYEASSPEEAALLERDQDMVPASPDEVAKRERERELYGKYGGTGQQAIGLAETFLRNASLGVITGLAGTTEQEQRERAQVLGEESPILKAAAGAAPAVAAGIATGGAGLGVAGTIAAEGALGGVSSLSAEQEAAWEHDKQLSSEAAFGSFGMGFLLGAAGSGVILAGQRALSPVSAGIRNRFVEASAKAERRAERSAFKSVGIDEPVDGLGDAVVDPVKGAKMRHAGRGAALDAKKEFGATLDELDRAEQAARRWSPPADVAAEGDAVAQRAAIRSSLDDLRKDLEPIAGPSEKGVVARAFEKLDSANTPDELLSAVSVTRQVLADTLEGAGDAGTAKALKRGVQRLSKLEQDSNLFGAPALGNAARASELQLLDEARVALTNTLGERNYLELVGMRDGAPIDEALDSYVDRLGAVLRSTNDPEAKEGLKSIVRLQRLRQGTLRKVAGLNQIDAMSAIDPGDVRPQAPSAGTAIMDIAEQAAKFGAAPQYQAYKIAKMAWSARKAARGDAGAAKRLALDVAGMVDPIVGPAKLAYKYRHHIAVLAETARDEAVAAAKRLVRTGKTKGKPLAERYAKEHLSPEAYERTRKVVEKLTNEPELLADKLAGEMGDLATVAPELVEQINARAAGAVQFLASKVPGTYGFALMHPDGPPPSHSDALEMALYVKGVTEPTEVVEAIADGSAMPEEIEAFRATYPTRFAELQDAVHEQVALSNQSGEVVPAHRLAQLETVLDLPGMLDPTFSDSVAFIGQMSAMVAEQAQKPSTYVPPPRAGNRIAPKGQSS